MPLTDTYIKALKPSAKPTRHADGGGLSLTVQPSGAKLWHYRYRLFGSPGTFSIGLYPEVTLAGARDAAREAKKLVKAGIDPVTSRQSDRLLKAEAQSNTFESVARDWMAAKKINWAPKTYDQCKKILEADVFPKIGKLPIAVVTAAHVKGITDKVAGRGAETVASLIQQWCGAVFRKAGASSLITHNPVSMLEAVVKPKTTHKTPLKKDQIAGLAKAMGKYQGNRQTLIAMNLLMLTFVRTGELRQARWEQFDLDANHWVVPAALMKKRREHVVPLSRQVVALLNELKDLTGNHISGYLFPNTRRPTGCMAATTINRALEYMGFNGSDVAGSFSGHGFRATASTMLHAMSYPSHVIDMQLAHKRRDTTHTTYNQYEYIAERTALMQHWADVIEQYTKPGSNVVAIGKVA